jgi:hypothetical protein
MTGGFRIVAREAFALAALIVLAALPSAASANHSITELVSTGPDAGAPSTYGGRPVLTSADGSRAYFETSDRLVPADGNESQDVYERAGGVTTLISTGPSGAASGAELLHVSSDGSRVTFSSYSRLTGEDHDDMEDIYQRSGGVTRLISTGPTDRYTGFSYGALAFFDGASADGTHVVFQTSGALVSADTDTQPDLYERVGGQTTLVSTGPTDNGSAGIYPYGGFTERSPISDDGTHIFFLTDAKLAPEDVDAAYDYYERSGGTTKLVSTGPTDTGTMSYTTAQDFDRSADGTHVIFTSLDRLTADDHDNFMDVYERLGNTTTLVSTGPTDSHTQPACSTASGGLNCPGPPHISDDGSHIFFFTYQSLTSEDTDSSVFYDDLYDRSGAIVRLVSIGPTGGNGPYHVSSAAPVFSADGSHVFFSTAESLVPADADTAQDIYERNAGTTTLVSTGPPESNPNLVAPFGPAATSTDGLRLFWVSNAPSIPGTAYDIYERYAGATTLIGPSEDGDYYYTDLLGMSPDGTRVFYNTIFSLVPEDTDVCTSSSGSHGCVDTYEQRVASVGPQSPAGSTAALPDYGAVMAKGESSALP